MINGLFCLLENTKSLYPSFMLHDLNAKELGLNQEQIEQFISQLDNTLQKRSS